MQHLKSLNDSAEGKNIGIFVKRSSHSGFSQNKQELDSIVINKHLFTVVAAIKLWHRFCFSSFQLKLSSLVYCVAEVYSSIKRLVLMRGPLIKAIRIGGESNPKEETH
jgi:hypothetical protein